MGPWWSLSPHASIHDADGRGMVGARLGGPAPTPGRTSAGYDFPGASWLGEQGEDIPAGIVGRNSRAWDGIIDDVVKCEESMSHPNWRLEVGSEDGRLGGWMRGRKSSRDGTMSHQHTAQSCKLQE